MMKATRSPSLLGLMISSLSPPAFYNGQGEMQPIFPILALLALSELPPVDGDRDLPNTYALLGRINDQFAGVVLILI